MPLKDKNIHLFFEALAVFILAPYLLFLNITHITHPVHKIIIYIIIIGTLLVDGYLLSQINNW